MDEDQRFSYLEPPWIDNRPFESCVPSGSYAGVMMNSPRFGPVYYLIGGNVVYEEKDVDEVQTRYLCIAGHSANWHQQLQGCGAFGMGHEENRAKPFRLQSLPQRWSIRHVGCIESRGT